MSTSAPDAPPSDADRPSTDPDLSDDLDVAAIRGAAVARGPETTALFVGTDEEAVDSLLDHLADEVDVDLVVARESGERAAAVLDHTLDAVDVDDEADVSVFYPDDRPPREVRTLDELLDGVSPARQVGGAVSKVVDAVRSADGGQSADAVAGVVAGVNAIGEQVRRAVSPVFGDGAEAVRSEAEAAAGPFAAVLDDRGVRGRPLAAGAQVERPDLRVYGWAGEADAVVAEVRRTDDERSVLLAGGSDRAEREAWDQRARAGAPDPELVVDSAPDGRSPAAVGRPTTEAAVVEGEAIVVADGDVNAGRTLGEAVEARSGGESDETPLVDSIEKTDTRIEAAEQGTDLEDDQGVDTDRRS